ncbi:TrmH family RNA methyltransferase [Hominifimenecus sp. rT4P-3]|uniref:TrmH family RNA methyltransferase n=1 Tax=Hominifimenecus sp. rT4P-3 TaxID=3242979 RepID=UPI003DA2F759
MITSTSNAQVKQIVSLQTRTKARLETGLFVAEGTKIIKELPESLRIRVFASESYLINKENSNFAAEVGAEPIPDVVFRHMSDTKTPQGILAVARQQKFTLEDLLSGGPVIVLEGIQDPGNLGTIIRTGEAAGVGGILADRETADRYNPKVVRATMGAIYRVPYCVTENLQTDVKALKMRGFQVYAAHLKGTCFYDQVDYQKSTAFLIGNEGNGLTDSLAALADTYIRIPMEGKVESLNAAVAASILMYEAYRQNR